MAVGTQKSNVWVYTEGQEEPQKVTQEFTISSEMGRIKGSNKKKGSPTLIAFKTASSTLATIQKNGSDLHLILSSQVINSEGFPQELRNILAKDNAVLEGTGTAFLKIEPNKDNPPIDINATENAFSISVSAGGKELKYTCKINAAGIELALEGDETAPKGIYFSQDEHGNIDPINVQMSTECVEMGLRENDGYVKGLDLANMPRYLTHAWLQALNDKDWENSPDGLVRKREVFHETVKDEEHPEGIAHSCSILTFNRKDSNEDSTSSKINDKNFYLVQDTWGDTTKTYVLHKGKLIEIQDVGVEAVTDGKGHLTSAYVYFEHSQGEKFQTAIEFDAVNGAMSFDALDAIEKIERFCLNGKDEQAKNRPQHDDKKTFSRDIKVKDLSDSPYHSFYAPVDTGRNKSILKTPGRTLHIDLQLFGDETVKEHQAAFTPDDLFDQPLEELTEQPDEQAFEEEENEGAQNPTDELNKLAAVDDEKEEAKKDEFMEELNKKFSKKIKADWGIYLILAALMFALAAPLFLFGAGLTIGLGVAAGVGIAGGIWHVAAYNIANPYLKFEKMVLGPAIEKAKQHANEKERYWENDKQLQTVTEAEGNLTAQLGALQEQLATDPFNAELKARINEIQQDLKAVQSRKEKLETEQAENIATMDEASFRAILLDPDLTPQKRSELAKKFAPSIVRRLNMSNYSETLTMKFLAGLDQNARDAIQTANDKLMGIVDAKNQRDDVVHLGDNVELALYVLERAAREKDKQISTLDENGEPAAVYTLDENGSSYDEVLYTELLKYLPDEAKEKVRDAVKRFALPSNSPSNVAAVKTGERLDENDDVVYATVDKYTRNDVWRDIEKTVAEWATEYRIDDVFPEHKGQTLCRFDRNGKLRLADLRQYRGEVDDKAYKEAISVLGEKEAKRLFYGDIETPTDKEKKAGRRETTYSNKEFRRSGELLQLQQFEEALAKAQKEPNATLRAQELEKLQQRLISFNKYASKRVQKAVAFALMSKQENFARVLAKNISETRKVVKEEQKKAEKTRVSEVKVQKTASKKQIMARSKTLDRILKKLPPPETAETTTEIPEKVPAKEQARAHAEQVT